MKKFYVIAGEASGDMHAANMMREMKSIDQNVDFRFWGGDLMSEVAGPPVKHIKDLAFMGFVEVLMNLKTILGNIKFCKKDILAYAPDAIILVDYPGFNLRIAKWAKANGIKVIYYISPQIWAWKQNRVHLIKKVVDEMYVILPFEKDFYKKFDFEVNYVGHPLLDQIERFQAQVDVSSILDEYELNEKPIIALLPGSRKQEISIKLPLMLSAVKDFENYQVLVLGAPAQDALFYERFLEKHKKAKIVFGATYKILSIAEAALVTSGTATLETALFKVPQVVCYKGSAISYHIAKRLIKVDYISLVNLILNKESVRELIQKECTPEKIKQELTMVLPNGNKREMILSDYQELHDLLGKGGASKKLANLILK